jgi:cytosine deaminase
VIGRWPDRYVLDDVYRLGDGAPVSVAVAGGEVAAVTAPQAAPPWPRVQMGGRVLIPGLVDAHQHLDKTHLFPQLRNESGTLQEAIATVRAHYATCTVEEIFGRARRGLDLAIAAGTTAVRSHADTGTNAGLRGVEALLRLREAYSGRVRLQVVAMAAIDADGVLLDGAVREAVKMGVDAVGGAPWLAFTAEARVEYVDRLFRIAEDAALPVDLHTDESLDPADVTLRVIARRAHRSSPRSPTPRLRR